MNDPEQPSPTRGFFLGNRQDDRQDRMMEYDLTAPHGWEFLLDNHLEIEEDRREAVNHMAVLGEN